MTTNHPAGRSVLVVATAAVVGALPSKRAMAQWPPENLENLQVLPESLGVRGVINVMRSFAIGLGVRCQYCHVGEGGQPLSTFDFPSDEKSAKRKARVMLRMVQEINGNHLPQLEDRKSSTVEVACATCHRGLSRPRMLEDVISEVAVDEGAEAAVERYRELRDEYYGTYSYDFSEGVLMFASQSLGAQGRMDEAIALLELNLEFFPESANTYAGLGETYRQLGDTTRARKSFSQALELNPNLGFARRRLAELDSTN